MGIVPPGEASGSGGGTIGNIWEVRREVGRDVNAPFRGEAGTEFRSGGDMLVEESQA